MRIDYANRFKPVWLVITDPKFIACMVSETGGKTGNGYQMTIYRWDGHYLSSAEIGEMLGMHHSTARICEQKGRPVNGKRVHRVGKYSQEKWYDLDYEEKQKIGKELEQDADDMVE